MITASILNLKKYKTLFLKSWLLPIIIIILGLALRVPTLGEFVTIDEPLWVNRSHYFLGGLLFAAYECPAIEFGRSFETTGKACTFQTGHPGITTMWSGTLGLLLYYWQTVYPDGINLPTFLQTLTTDSLDPALIRLTRLPLTIVASLFLGLYYILLKRLFNNQIALIATLLVTLSPFHIALSRVLHHDGLTTTFMLLSALMMIGYWLKEQPRSWLFASALLAGFAFLSKSVGWFLMPYALLVGLLGLYFRQQWSSKKEIWRLISQGAIWGAIAWLTFVIFFPAMWVIPKETISGIISANFNVASEGHVQYLLGQVSPDPGPLFYPLGWLLRASPLEIVGLLTLPLALCFIKCRGLDKSQPTGIQNNNFIPETLPGTSKSGYSALIALALFIITFLLFVSLSDKKAVRYFLPAFPIIDIFIAYGLLWLIDNLSKISFLHPIRRWTMPILTSIILLTQGYFVFSHYPYYFTYYNPLLGGTPAAAQIITIFGWGEGLNEAGAYLNQQPKAELLEVVTWNEGPLSPFFKGHVRRFSTSAAKDLQADYLVYYYSQLQLQRQRNMALWLYLYNHYAPAHRVTMHGLDYVLTYHNPIEHRVEWVKNSLPNKLGVFGYNLSFDGNLKLFWQNLGLEDQPKLWTGLSSATAEEIKWLPCIPAPDFAAEVTTPEAILESGCSLASIAPSSDLYDLHVGLSNDDANISPIPFPAGRLALKVDQAGKFMPLEPAAGLALMLEQELPAEAIALDIPFGTIVRLVGYQLNPPQWEAGKSNEVILYWQPLREADFVTSLLDQFQFTLNLTTTEAKEPLATTTIPVFPGHPTEQTLKRAAIIQTNYHLFIPHTLPPGEYLLDVCLTTTNQALSQIDGCLPLPVVIPPQTTD